MSLGQRVTYADIMADIERLSDPMPDMLERLAESFIKIPPLAQKLRWCDIPSGDRQSVAERLRSLAAGYAEMRTPMAGSISRELVAAGRAVEMTIPKPL